MIRIAIVLGSARPGRLGKAVADWVHERAAGRKDAAFEVLDVADFNLPLLDEPLPPSMGKYTHGHTKAWSEAVAGFDGYIFVTGEYNHSIPGALKNALDYLFKEWNNKAAGFVSYGGAGGTRAVEHLRAVAGELHMADVRAQVVLPLATEFENYRTFKPSKEAEKNLQTLFDQVIAWAGALKVLRSGEEEATRSYALSGAG
ncbi:NAD(P)H-dependent oxidoreductase [Pseudarthrobacter equi]|uniref:NADPH-dependent FMN reductase n=1 Tax=Pseudarthrobacter TaxID=1742993 RepID=UPI00158469B9|nr:MULTISPECIES: NAD(P)H-dependent oxidoreductase [Pseudarthrobacter]MCT9625976.1 NAD(P)H-dependent oxidoreductase [Pseudarthrobacter equi]NUT72172.1 NAD(P)H-dependent oxidoreductase [Pseudarthrobacter sp. C4D7]